MAPTEYRVYEAGIEVARQSTTVYIVGVASTKYVYQAHVACIEVVTRSPVVYKVGVAPTEHGAHEACVKVRSNMIQMYYCL